MLRNIQLHKRKVQRAKVAAELGNLTAVLGQCQGLSGPCARRRSTHAVCGSLVHRAVAVGTGAPSENALDL